MRRIMIDPGTRTHGLVVAEGERVLHAESKAGAWTVEMWLRAPDPALVLVERVAARGVADGNVMRTCEWSARFRTIALEEGHETVWLYRRHVTAVLKARGRSTDARVRARMREYYGAEAWEREGWLSGVKGHAVQALALGVAYDLGAREVSET